MKKKNLFKSLLVMFAFIVVPALYLNAAVAEGASLTSLKVNGETIDVTTDPTKSDFTMTVAHDVTEVTVEAGVDDSVAEYVVKNATAGKVTLTGDTTNIEIEVTNKAENTKKTTYTIAVTKEAAPVVKTKAVLESLSVEGQSISFAEETLKYTLTVKNEVSEVKISATGKDGANVSGIGTKTLEVGLNTFEVVASKEGSESTKYVIEITREEAVTNPVVAEVEEALKDTNIEILNASNDSMTVVETTELSDGTIVNRYLTISLKDATKEDVLKTIEDDMSSQRAYLTLPETNILSKEAMAIVKESAGSAYFQGGMDSYWTFDGSKFTGKEDAINLNIKIGDEVAKETKEAIEKLLVDKNKGLVIDFAHSGKLPEGTKVTIYVGDKFKENESLSLYFYNTKTKKLELVSKDIKVDEYKEVEFALDHCSSYVLTVNSNNAQTGAMNVVLYVIIAVSSLAGIAFLAKRKFN